MRKSFYPKLALSNIKNNSKTYFPYILTCIFTIMMFFMMHTLSRHKEITALSLSLKEMLSFGSVVIGIFSAIFLFYTNSFLIKRRKKEIGLYNILGMEKRHIMKVLFYETMFVSIISLLLGLLGGVIFGNLIFMILLKILQFMAPVSFSLSFSSVIITILLFTCIFLVTLLTNLTQIHLAKPVELLKGGNHGEKEPKTNWVIAVIGFASLTIAYVIALSAESPFAALKQFLVAVILVMIGTYALFTAGSIAILKLLRKKKHFYYKPNHFTAVSGMIYRMKQNAAGLANICILSTAVLVVLSTTISLYVGMEDALLTRCPQDFAIEVPEYFNEAYNPILEDALKKYNMSLNDYTSYNYVSLSAEQKNGNLRWIESSNPLNMYGLLTVGEYNRLENKTITLSKDEALLLGSSKEIDTDIIKSNNITLSVKNIDNSIIEGNWRLDTIDKYIIVSDEDVIKNLYHSLTGKELLAMSFHIGFDINGNTDDIISYSNLIKAQIQTEYPDTVINSKQLLRESFIATYGGLFFLGIFIGTLFLMATVLIIYYKQISEGFDDKKRFEIMQKVGMSKREVKKTIKSQILMIFFLPLIAAIVHIAFAFKALSKILALFNLTNIPLFVCCMAATTLIFIIIYAVVYGLTAKTYYKIVS